MVCAQGRPGYISHVQPAYVMGNVDLFHCFYSTFPVDAECASPMYSILPSMCNAVLLPIKDMLVRFGLFSLPLSCHIPVNHLLNLVRGGTKMLRRRYYE